MARRTNKARIIENVSSTKFKGYMLSSWDELAPVWVGRGTLLDWGLTQRATLKIPHATIAVVVQ